MSKSSRVAWAACTACMLELMVPVSACWADVCNTRAGEMECLEAEKVKNSRLGKEYKDVGKDCLAPG